MVGLQPPWPRLSVSSLKVGLAWQNDFQSFLSCDIGIITQKMPQKFGVKEVAFKNSAKIISYVLYLKIPFHPYQSTFGVDEFFFSFFFQNTLCLFPVRHSTKKNKLHQMCYCGIRTFQTKSIAMVGKLQLSDVNLVALVLNRNIT